MNCKSHNFIWVVLFFTFGVTSISANEQGFQSAKRPNILWLSTEDIGCQLSCYGDKTAATPNLEKLAKRGMVYDVAWSNYPVCAPARTTIITGMYAAANGAGNMRSNVKLDSKIKMFPQLLREAGYACYNNSKEDYNHPKPGKVWDESSRKAHFRKRKKGQPFFSVFNFTGTHESRIRNRPHQAVINPLDVKLLPYWPDTPEVRKDWAQYYDNLVKMDNWIGKKLDDLERSRQTDNTIVVFFGDHGSGMPRHKRYAGESGMRVPMVVYIPEGLKQLQPQDYQSGGRTSRPVGFVDLAPSMLNVAGVSIPKEMQGTPFLGKSAELPKPYVLGLRGRMDERVDLSRSIRDQRFVYIRNFMPFLPHGQKLNYQMITPTTRVWKEKYSEGELNEVQSAFWKRKPAEELYDLSQDPHETVNLVDDPAYKEDLDRLRIALKQKLLEVRDAGFLPEPILQNIKQKSSIRDYCARSENYPFNEIYDLATLAASQSDPGEQLKSAIKSSNAIKRYWGLVGYLNREKPAFAEAKDAILNSLDDQEPTVAIAAAELIAKNDSDANRSKALGVLLRYADPRENNFFAAVHALNAIDRLDGLATPIFEQLALLPKTVGNQKRGKDYLQRLHEHIRD